jgi:hypothetical protein
MAPKVRLPLVELSDATKAEVAAVVGELHENFADYIIGEFREPALSRRA